MALAGADLDYAKEAFSLIDDDEDGQLKGDQCQTAVFAVCAALKGTAPTLQQLAGLPGYNASQMDEAAFLSAVGGIVADDKLTGDNPFTGMDRKKTGKVKVEDLKSVLGTVGDALTEDELAFLLTLAPADGDGKVSHSALWDAIKTGAVNRA